MKRLICDTYLKDRASEYCLSKEEFERFCEIIDAEPTYNQWIPCSERMPENSENLVLVQVTGRLRNIEFDNAYELATYNPDDGWIIEEYPEWENPVVTAWMPLPEPWKEVDIIANS